MRLFKVVQIFVNLGEGKTDYRPAVREIIVLKETPKNYLVEASIGTGWGSRVSKDDRSYSFTPVEAWDKYIARARKVLATMRMEVSIQCDCITYAESERRNMITSYDDVKIGGTD